MHRGFGTRYLERVFREEVVELRKVVIVIPSVLFDNGTIEDYRNDGLESISDKVIECVYEKERVS